MSSNFNNDTNQSHRNHVREIAEAKHHTRQALIQAERFGAPPDTAALGVSGDENLSRPAQAIADLHATILDYHDQLAPFANRVPSLWEGEFWETEIPVSASSGSGSSTQHAAPANVKEPEFIHVDEMTEEDWDRISSPTTDDGPKKKPVTLSLATLNEWRMRSVTYSTLEHDAFTGDKSTQHTTRLFIPAGAAAVAYRRLNQMLERLNLAAEVRAVETGDAPADVDANPAQLDFAGDAHPK